MIMRPRVERRDCMRSNRTRDDQRRIAVASGVPSVPIGESKIERDTQTFNLTMRLLGNSQ